MLPFAFLFFFAFIIYIEMGVYVFLLNRKSQVNIWYFIMCIVFAIWSMDNVLFHVFKDIDKIWFYHRIFSFSWCIFPGIMLQTALVISGYNKILRKWWFYIVLYLPGIILSYREISGETIVSKFIPNDFGWKTVYNTASYQYWVYNIYYVLYLLISIVTIFIWSRKTGTPREKKQSYIITASGITAFFIGFITDTLLPILNIQYVPPMATFFILIIIFGTWYAIAKYNFMAVTPSFAADEIVSSMMDIMFILNPDGFITSVNQRAVEIMDFQDNELIGKSFLDIVIEWDTFHSELKEMLNKSSYKSVLRLNLITRKFSYVPIGASVSRINNKDNEIAGILIVGQDLTLSRQLQVEISEKLMIGDLLKGEKANFYLMMQNAPYGIMYVDLKGDVQYINSQFTNITGYLIDDIPNLEDWFWKAFPDAVYRKDIKEKWMKDMGLEGIISSSFRVTCGRGELKEIEFKTSYLNQNRIIITLQDITDKKKAEEEIRLAKESLEIRVVERTAELEKINKMLIEEINERNKAEKSLSISLQEKEILLKEIHHRVKNNLQIISSLLALQSNNIVDQQTLEIFRESQNRIRSIALIHEKLYQSPVLSNINMEGYINNLVSDLLYSYNVNQERIKTVVQIDNISLNIETAMPCGLVLNELLSNCIKHAFPGNMGGLITIKFKMNPDNYISMEVSDNGVGFPKESLIKNSSSLGMKLIRNLTKQLSGKLDIDNNGGTTIKIIFMELSYQERR